MSTSHSFCSLHLLPDPPHALFSPTHTVTPTTLMSFIESVLLLVDAKQYFIDHKPTLVCFKLECYILQIIRAFLKEIVQNLYTRAELWSLWWTTFAFRLKRCVGMIVRKPTAALWSYYIYVSQSTITSTFIFQYDKDTLQYTLSSKYKFSCFLLEYLHIRLKLLSNNSVFNSLVIH